MESSRAPRLRLGLDENGLGPRLGPLVVTAVAADVDERAEKRWKRRLPKGLRADLDDSKALVSCRDVSLGEAWARVVAREAMGHEAKTPRGLLARLSLQDNRTLRADCPPSTEKQCFFTKGERFLATEAQLATIAAQLRRLERIGIRILGARSELVCTGRLNALRAQGIHRFGADLHSMERLILHFRRELGASVWATCGKVGGITKYEPYFGPLAGHLRTTLQETRKESVYYFPQVGEIRFAQDADAHDPLVMLASLIGKYVREVLMNRISRFYAPEVSEELSAPSGYHDPITNGFVKQTVSLRRKLDIAQDCFERIGADQSQSG